MNLFKLFKKDPAKKLRKEYHLKLEKALHAQRNGNIREYSFLTSEAEAVKERLDAVNVHSEGNGQSRFHRHSWKRDSGHDPRTVAYRRQPVSGSDDF